MSDSVPPPPPPSGAMSPPPPPGAVPPPPGAVPPPPGAVPPPPAVTPSPYAPMGAAPAFQPTPGFESDKPPRPQVRVGSILVIVGAVVAILGTFLPWADLDSETGTGFDFYRFRDNLDVIEFDSPGVVVLFFGAPLIGLGLALLFAGRLLAVAIISIVLSSIAAIVGLVMIGLMAAVTDDVGGDIGLGVVLTLIGPLIALAGAIAATAKRRRWT